MAAAASIPARREGADGIVVDIRVIGVHDHEWGHSSNILLFRQQFLFWRVTGVAGEAS